MPRQFNSIRAAAALVEACLKPDREVSQAFGISTRTLEYWRHRLKTDRELQQVYKAMAREKLAQWVTEIPEVLDGAIGFLKRATVLADPADPKAIDAIVGAITALNELQIIHESLQQNRE